MGIEINGMSDGYKYLIDMLQRAPRVAPRGIPTRELVGFSFTLKDPYDNLPLATGRKLNTKIGIAEAMQLVSGRSFPELMVRIAPNFAQFTNGGAWFHGAYGPRLRRQLAELDYRFGEDESTRQGIVTIWDPNYDGEPGDVNDTPCTIALQFLARNGELNMVTTMRSNDVWWGTPYDVYQFTTLQIHVAASLGLDVGAYVHQAGSFHMYERDAEAASRVTHGDDLSSHVKSPQLITRAGDHGWEIMRDVAEAILKDEGHRAMSPWGEKLRAKLHG